MRNIQSWTWYETVIMRPLAILLLYPVADFKFLSPNLMTSIGNVLKMGGAWLILVSVPGDVLWAFVLLQLGVLFDHFDGTLARYQRRWSAFGSFYDKVSDFVTWTAIVLAIAWVEGERTGSSLPLLLAAVSTNAQAVMGYTKWLARAETEKLRWHQAKHNPTEAIEKNTRPPVTACPPERSVGEWMRWLGRKMLNIFAFQEMDMFLWVGILLLMNEYMLSLWVLLGIHGLGVVGMVGARLWEMRTLDSKLRPFR
ncbi:MAG: CDP-alcohol phosphatidyltransferase family protein [Myxococcales bacterium]|nr:CDP-alcohol phosphatidyltransferase family protein [Myxococcales bacterium]